MPTSTPPSDDSTSPSGAKRLTTKEVANICKKNDRDPQKVEILLYDGDAYRKIDDETWEAYS